MSHEDAIVCPACGKRYAYKPEMAGRRLKCKCGGVISVPLPPTPEPMEDQFDAGVDESYEAEQQSSPAYAPPAPTGSARQSGATSSAADSDTDTWKWWYYIGAGICMLALGFFEYSRLKQLDNGEVTSLRVNRIEGLVYDLVGSIGVLVFFLLLSATMFTIGVRKFIRERNA